MENDKVLTKTTYGYNARTGNITLSTNEVKAIEAGDFNVIKVWAPNHTKLKAVIVDPQKYLSKIKSAPNHGDYFLLSYRGFEVR